MKGKKDQQAGIEDLRKTIDNHLPHEGKPVVEIPVGRVFRTQTLLTIQEELRQKGFEAFIQGKGNTSFVRIKKKPAFAT